MRSFLVLIFLTAVSAFDVIREAFKYVNDQIDPCDNFYRHACPVSFGGLLIQNEYRDLLFKLKVKTADAVWNNLEIEETIQRTHFKEISSITQFISNLFQELCEDQNVSQKELENYLDQIEHYFFGYEKSKCKYYECLSALAYDQNCARAAGNLQQTILKNSGEFDNTEVFQAFSKSMFFSAKIGLDGANAILDGDARNGVKAVNSIVETLKKKLTSWIKQTPWARNNEATDAILVEALQVHPQDDYGRALRQNLQYLFKMEQDYLKCLGDTKNNEDFKVFCMFMAVKASAEIRPTFGFFTYFNAMNSHPNLFFSHLFYDMAQNVEEPAAILGSVGYIVGHELSHSLIEDANNPELLPYFSNESMQCIQNQFQKTCDNFKELSCATTDNQIDENGSDMLGLQLAYSVFEDLYEERMQEEYIKIASFMSNSTQTITMEQLFFYSTAFMGCVQSPLGQGVNDPHAPLNIRLNTMVQHPGFRKAFNCASDSRMVQSFNDQCVIFGDEAPEARL